MISDDRRIIWLWAQRILGTGTRLANAAMEIFGTPAALFEADETALKTAGIFAPQKVQNILAHDLSWAYKTLREALEMGFHVMTREDDDYPELLGRIHSPPLCLFMAGDRSCLSHALPVAMVGTRKPNRYGIETAKLCAGGLAGAGALIVSGLAEGIDTACHSAALREGAPTVAVIGCGLDIDYPKPNRELRRRIEAGGCVISEYPPGAPPLPGQFPVRNRIISGLSLGCVVVQCGLRSGSLITAGLALGQNRDVFALCGPVNDPLMAGCHELIRQGAKPVFGILDVLDEYPAYSGVKNEARVALTPSLSALPEYLTETQVEIVKLLRRGPQPVEAVAELTGISLSRLLELLTELEIFGLVEPQAGRVYRAT